MGLIELGIGLGALVLWPLGLLIFIYRGVLLPGAAQDDLKFEVATARGLFKEHLTLESALAGAQGDRRHFLDAALEAHIASIRRQRRLVVRKAWRYDPSFKTEVQRRYRQQYPWHHAYIALICGGAWSLTFILTEPLQERLVPAGFDVLFPVYTLVAPWWVAIAVMTVRERIKAAQRRSQRKRV